MPLRYADAIERLFSLRARGMRMGIERMHDAVRFRGFDPSALPPVIQVAGTNGKGSVSAMIAGALQAAGYRVGLFTSPHLHRFTERVRISGAPIGTREAARRIESLLQCFGRPGAPDVSFFELSTLLAVEAFCAHGCEVAVLEVGLGGRLDATTALPANLSVITRIALDHTQLLGSTLGAIAKEKAGIIRAGVPLILGTRAPAARREILAVARRCQAPVRVIDRDFREYAPTRRSGGVACERLTVEVDGKRVSGLRLALPGEHQRENASIAVAALVALREQGFAIPQDAIRRGLARVRWPARLERVAGRPSMLLDAAHNPDGCAALARHLAGCPQRPRVLVFGAVADKAFARMLRLLSPQVEHVVYLPPRIERAAEPAALQSVLPGEVARDVPDALARARSVAGTRGLVVVAGSLFLVADLRARVLRLPSDPPIRL